MYSIYLGVQILHSVAAGLNIIMKACLIQLLKYLVAAVTIYTVLHVISGCSITNSIDRPNIGPVPIIKLEF